MEPNNEILNEMLQLSNVVAFIGNANVYKVPAAYFDNLPDDVFTYITINGISKNTTVYSVPEGYFESFADLVLSKVKQNNIIIGTDINNELAITAPLLTTLSKENVYALPANFFADFADKVLDNVIPGISERKDTFSVPDNYFDNFASSVLAKIRVENTGSKEVYNELEQIAPLLNSINKGNVYSVPDNYFEKISVENTINKPETKVIEMKMHRSNWLKYAVAACIIAILGTGIYFYFNSSSTTQLARIDYPILEKINVEQGISKLSDDEIKNYLNVQPVSTDLIPASNDDNDDFQILLDNTPDDEINQYLNDNKEPGSKNI